MNNPDQDLIDMIAKANPDIPINEAHRERLRQQVLDAYDNRADADAPAARNPLFTFTGATLMKFAASIALLSVIAFFAITALTPSKAVAFEDVAKAVLEIDNASYVTQTVIYEEGKEPVTQDSYKVYLQFPQRFRVDLKMDQMDVVMIADVPADKMIMLNAQKKEAFLIEGLSSFADEENPTNLIAEIQDHFRKAQQDKALGKVKYEQLGEKAINGQQAIGYRVEDPADTDFDTIDIWADAKTALPIRIVYTSTIDERNKVMHVLDSFKYDQTFEASVFSLTAPQGYKLIKASDLLDGLDRTKEQLDQAINKVIGVEAPLLEDLALAMALYAGQTGKLPEQLISGPMIDTMVEAWEKANPGKPLFKDDDIEMADEEMNAAFESVLTAYEFLENLKQQGIEYTYAGSGIEIGDKDTPVFWYKPKGADTFKVIYADMTIREAALAPQKP